MLSGSPLSSSPISTTEEPLGPADYEFGGFCAGSVSSSDPILLAPRTYSFGGVCPGSVSSSTPALIVPVDYDFGGNAPGVTSSSDATLLTARAFGGRPASSVISSDVVLITAPPVDYPAEPEDASITYAVALTGTPDLTLPISSAQIRKRSGGRDTFLSVVVPASSEYIDDINARTDGEIVITRRLTWSDGTIEDDEIARSAFESFREDRGGRRSSATLSGYKAPPEGNPDNVHIGDLSYVATSDGKRQVRSKANNKLKPGDTAIYDSEGFSMIVGDITYTIGIGLDNMEAKEA